jgi:hypothetical protein
LIYTNSMDITFRFLKQRNVSYFRNFLLS